MSWGGRVVVAGVGILLVRPVQAQPTPTLPQRAGRITVARAINSRGAGSSADAIFAASPVLGTVTGSDGPCTAHFQASRAGLSAGSIRITGTVDRIWLAESPTDRGVSYRNIERVHDPAFFDGAAITVQASGGSDVPAFTGTVMAPATLASYTPPTSLSRAGYTATWAAGSGPEMMIEIGALDRDRHDAILVDCRVPDTGTFTVPASTFQLIPSSYDQVIVSVARVGETVVTVGDTRVAIDVVSTVGAGPVPLTQSAADPGDAAARSRTPAGGTWETSPRKFLSLAFGFGGLSRVGNAPPTRGPSWRMQFGQRLGHGLHLVEEVNSLGSDYLSPAPIDFSEVHTSFGTGIRWTPFEPRPHPSSAWGPFPGRYVDVRAFYLTTVIGADVRDRTTQSELDQTTEHVSWSPMASVAVGLLEIQGEDWSLGPEFREQLARYDGQFQRGWQLFFAIHLN